MRYHFMKIDLPRRLAKALRAELAALGVVIRNTEAQSLFARIYGYRDWAELVRITGTVPPSPPDEACSPEVAEARRAYRLRVLSELISSDQARDVLLRLLRPRGKGAAKAPALTILVWWLEGDIHFATPNHDPRYGDRVLRIAPVAGYPGPRYELRTGYPRLAAEGGVPFNVIHGKFESVDDAKREADWIELCNDPWIWASGDWVERDPDHPMQTPFSEPDEVWRVADGIMRVEADSSSYRVDPEFMAIIPEILRVRVDAKGYGWYHAKQRVLLVTAMPHLFGAKARRFAELDLPKSFPAIAATIHAPIEPSASTLRRVRKEIVGAEHERCDRRMLFWMNEGLAGKTAARSVVGAPTLPSFTRS